MSVTNVLMPHELRLPASPLPHPVCLYKCVCVCVSLINCCPKIKRSHFLLVTPATRAWLRDECVFLWPAVKLGGHEPRRRDVKVHGAPRVSMSDLNDQSGHTHRKTMVGALHRSIELVCIIWFMIEDSYRDSCTVSLAEIKTTSDRAITPSL